MDDECQTVSVPDAGKALGLTRHGAYDAAKRGEIFTLRFGRLLRVPKAWLERTLKGNCDE
jgi:hypothetical protein